MKWVNDTTGRFVWRPFYTQEELDNECEQIVSGFLMHKYGVVRFPITTDDLTIMVERDTSDLDLFADLTLDGEDIEGSTDFYPHKKPVVKISQQLSVEDSRYLRLRTTLAHEYGHVRFHTFLWEMNSTPKTVTNIMKKLTVERKAMSRLRQKLNPDQSKPPTLDDDHNEIFSPFTSRRTFRCTRGLILQAPVSDWMEWQASYICGAILMPLTAVRKLVKNYENKQRGVQGLPGDTDLPHELAAQVAHAFDVSDDAARLRLIKIGYLQPATQNVAQ
ncbi:MAG: hypothetical protein PHE50_02860 [Dehalococcoidales bacterium]|nr:hypothetical protein [Dehalococcoidales bacterium]